MAFYQVEKLFCWRQTILFYIVIWRQMSGRELILSEKKKAMTQFSSDFILYEIHSMNNLISVMMQFISVRNSIWNCQYRRV